MAETTGILAIDQGTTSSRAIVFDAQSRIVSVAQREFAQHFPANGWVEHDPEEIWTSTLAVCRDACAAAEAKGVRVAAIGVTNQRETAIIWDRETGKPIHNAIVWQDRRTAKLCARLINDGMEEMVRARTGLVIDPYFSATKIGWILDNVEGARAKADAGRLAAGTIDTFLIWRLSGGTVHATDATNASRTSLYNIESHEWDADLLKLFRVPPGILPDIRDSNGDYGMSESAHFGAPLPICGVAGDQQAAAIGQACFEPGDVKSTYGTGCFVLSNTGTTPIRSRNRLLTTVASMIDGRAHFALEGSIFIAGAGVQWLRDGLGIIGSASETQGLAESLGDNKGVYIVPAFTGLGAPYWKPDVRGAIFGLTRSSGPAELARAMVEAVCYQTADLLTAMAEDGQGAQSLRVDGGMAANDWMCTFLADILGLTVARPAVMETTALGAAYLAGMKMGIFGSTEEIARDWRAARTFEPSMAQTRRVALLDGWARAVQATLVF